MPPAEAPTAPARQADKRAEEEASRMPEQKIPRKIWQRCGARPLSKVHQAYSHTWAERNPEYLHAVCDDAEAAAFVSDHYPALRPVYDRLRDRRASEEFWAYLVLFKCGGVFAALDCTCERPLHRLVAGGDDMLVGMQPKVASRVLRKQLGLEHHTFPLQQWCVAAAPGHPVLRYMIDHVANNINRSARACARARTHTHTQQ
jgi:mannosyltransferase OCH1-like enzyme